MTAHGWGMAHAAAEAHRPPDQRSGCPGVFRVTEDDGKRPAVATCDGCGASMGVRQSTLKGEPAAQTTEAMEW